MCQYARWEDTDVPKTESVEMDESIQKSVLSAFEVALEAQLRAIRRLKNPEPEEKRRKSKGMSQVDMVYDILRAAGKPLHITEILKRIESTFGLQVDRESIVSSLVKKVRREDRFVRTDKNVFGLRQGA
jgi:hypothetical protein